MKTIVFDQRTKEFILDLFDKKEDSDGYIVERKGGSRVMTPDGAYVKSEDFAGITPGSEIFLTKDLPSLLKYANREVENAEAAV